MRLSKLICSICALFICLNIVNTDIYASTFISDLREAEFNKEYNEVWSYDHCSLTDKISIDEKGILQLSLKYISNDEQYSPEVNIEIYDYKQNKVWTHNTWYMEDDLNGYYHFYIGLLKGDYYIRLSSEYYFDSMNITYSYAFEECLTEIENNDSFDQATYINLAHMYKGYIGQSTKDEDVYEFEVIKEGTYRLYIDNYKALMNTSVIIDLCNYSGEDIDTLFYGVNYDADMKMYYKELTLTKGTYYIKIWNYYGSLVDYKVGVYSKECKVYGHKITSSKVLLSPTINNNGISEQYCGTCGTTLTTSLPRICQFKDVTGNQWYFDTIVEVNNLGLMTGASETLFKPDAYMTRGMVACVLYRMEGSPVSDYNDSFKDLKLDQYYSDAVIWAKGEGVINGYGDGTFRAEKTITREEMAQMLYNFIGYKKADYPKQASLSKFKDQSKVSSWHKDAMKWAVAYGIISGKYNETKLDPQGTATRAECAKMLLQTYKLLY